MVVVVAIVVTTTESLAEIVVVVVLRHVIPVITVVRVLICVTVSIVGRPAILSVCRSSVEALLIAVVDSLFEYIYTVLICFVVGSPAGISIAGTSVEIRIARITMVTSHTQLLLTELLDILLLVTILSRTFLLL